MCAYVLICAMCMRRAVFMMHAFSLRIALRSEFLCVGGCLCGYIHAHSCIKQAPFPSAWRFAVKFCVWVFAWVYTCTYACAMCMRRRGLPQLRVSDEHICMCVYIYIHICMYIYTDAYTHTYIHTYIKSYFQQHHEHPPHPQRPHTSPILRIYRSKMTYTHTYMHT